jgi:hypothetical protein
MKTGLLIIILIQYDYNVWLVNLIRLEISLEAVFYMSRRLKSTTNLPDT